MKYSVFKMLIILLFFSQNDFVYSNVNNLAYQILWQENFDKSNIKDWQIENELPGKEEPNWYVENGYLIQNANYGDSKKLLGTNIIYESRRFGDFTLLSNIVCGDDDYLGILFRYQDIDNYYRFLLSSDRKSINIDKKVDGEFTTLAKYTDEEWQKVKFSITIFLKKDTIKVYLNDNLFFNILDNQFPNGKIGFTSIKNRGSFFDDITLYSDYEISPVEIKQTITRGPYLQNVLDNHAVIMWNTALPTKSVIEYGESQHNTNVISDDILKTTHEIKIDSLKQETQYYYRIKVDDSLTEWYSFKTAVNPNSPFKFIAYGDTQMNFLRHTEIVEQIRKHDFDFILHCGDAVQRGLRSDWDTEFFEPLKQVLTSKPIYTAIGNHELNSKYFYENFSYPNSEHENYYSFSYGNAFFIFLDNPRAAYPNKEIYLDFKKGSEQYKWLESELSSERAQSSQWRFVISHVPSYVGGRQDSFKDCKDNLVPLFEKYNVDISFSGHVHGYERGVVNGVNYIVTAGGGGRIQNISDSSKKFQRISNTNFQLVYNFCVVEITNEKLKLIAYDNQGNKIDEFTLNH